MLTLVSTSEIVMRVRYKNVASIIDDSKKADYKYNPFLGESIDVAKNVCNRVSSIIGSSDLVADIKRLHITGLKCRAKVEKLFTKVVSGPILELPNVIKSVVKTVKVVVKTMKTVVKTTRGVRVLRPAISGSSKHGRSSVVGRLFGRCICGDHFKIILSDHYNKVAVCRCGLMKDVHMHHSGYNGSS